MDSKSLTLLVGFILVIIMVFLLISYSYYPLSDSNSIDVLVDAQAAQAIASKLSEDTSSWVDPRKAQIMASQLRKDKDVWAQWSEKIAVDK